MLNQASKNTTPVLVSDDKDSITMNSGNNRQLLLVKVKQTFNLTNTVKKAYLKCKLYSKILEITKAHALFKCRDGIVITKNLLM